MDTAISGAATAEAQPIDGHWSITETRPLPDEELYFCTLTRSGRSGRLLQTPHVRSAFNRVAGRTSGTVDTYISQAMFRAPNRKTRNVAALTHAWADLDTYKSEIADLSIDDVVRAVRDRCANQDLPAPSEIIFSGQGFYLKWHLASIQGPDAVQHVRAINRGLCGRFIDFGADRVATDAARVLRLPGSVHGETGELVRVVHRETDDLGRVRRYAFDTLAAIRGDPAGEDGAAHDAGLVHLGPQRHRWGRTSTDDGPRAGSQWCWATWHEKVLADLETLAELRWQSRSVPEGWRDLFCFLGAVQLAHLRPRPALWTEIRAWANRFVAPGFVDRAFAQYCSTLLDRAGRAAAGETVTAPNGKTATLIYTHSKTRLRALLDVAPSEEPHLAALIGEKEKTRRARNRARQRRRDAGQRTRAQHQGDRAAAADTVASEIRRRRETGETWQNIAVALGVSEKAARRRLENARRRWRNQGDPNSHAVGR